MSAERAVYLPSAGPETWRWLLASPDKHWRHGFSAMALAYAWEQAEGWPPEVEKGLTTSESLTGTELLLALPELETPLRGRGKASQSDVFALGRTRDGEQVAITVEGKVDEPFGTKTVGEWRENGSAGKQERLTQLCDVLGLADDDTLAGLQYQLLHRTAAAVLEANRFGARQALMLVHSFSPDNARLDEYVSFGRVLGADPAPGAVVPARTVGGVQLHLGWVTGDIRPPRTLSEGHFLTERFDQAVTLARALHASQFRKDTDIPYLAHLLAVAALVIEDGGDEDEAIAAVLHDAVEDQGGPPTRDRIRQLFGDRVAKIVDECSDTDAVEKPPWRARKEAYIEHLESASPSALRVSLADKLHNARAILFDRRELGEALWDRFTTKSGDDQVWYYGALADAYEARGAGPMAAELRRTVDEIIRVRSVDA